MKKFFTFIVIVILIPIFFSMCVQRIPPATVGVRATMWGGGGIGAQDYQTGFHVGISGYHKWYTLPTKTHFIHFTESRSTQRSHSETEDWNAPLNPRTRDNNIVTIDVSIAYRIIEDEAYQIVKDGIQGKYRNLLKSRAISVLMAELPKLSSEDLQITAKRLERIEMTLPILNKAMAELHCKADSILIRRITFPADYENKLQEKQYLRQKANLDGALTLQAEEEKKVNIIDRQIGAAEKSKTEEWELRIQEKKSEFEVIIAQIRADAAIYAATTKAEGEKDRIIAEANGQLAVEVAEALRNELRTAALNAEGGSILLGLTAAENLQLPKVILNSDDPAVPTILNLDQLTKMLVGGGKE